MFHDEDGSDDLSIEFGDPATISQRIQVLYEVTDDDRHEGLKLQVPSVFPGVEYAVTMNYPPEVSRFWIAQLQFIHGFLFHSAFGFGSRGRTEVQLSNPRTVDYKQ